MSNENMVLFIISIIVAFPIGFILSGIFWPLYSLLRKIFYVPFVRKRLLKKAVEEGHTITARRAEKEERPFRLNPPAGRHQDFYIWEVNGKKCWRLLSSWREMPNTLTLYYQKNPNKADLAESFGLRENPTWFLQYLFFSLITGVISIFIVYNHLVPYLQNIINK